MTESLIVDFEHLLQEAKAGSAWPEGQYDFEILDAEYVLAGTGSPMIKCKMRCLVGANAGKTVSNNFVLSVDSPTALRIFFRHMRAFGLDDNFFRQIGKGNLYPVAAALRGRRARFTITHREWPKGSGEMSNDYSKVDPIEGMPAGGPILAAGMPPMPGPTGPQTPQPFGATAPPQPGYGGLDVFKQDQPQGGVVPGVAPSADVPPQYPPQNTVPPPPTPPLGAPEQPAYAQPQAQQPYGVVQQPPQIQQPPAQPYGPQQPYGMPQQPYGAATMNGASEAPPPGFTAEQWAALPEATKQAIKATQTGQSVAQPPPI